MNIMITLPQNLIAAILNGEKTIEIRKSRPLHFDCNNDGVYICKKGCAQVVAFFQLREILHVWNPDQFYDDHGSELAIPRTWFFEYVKGHKVCYAWVISKAWLFDTPIALESFSDVEKAPQQYVYTERPIDAAEVGFVLAQKGGTVVPPSNFQFVTTYGRKNQ